MRCPKCLIKTSDLEGHVKRDHPECDKSSTSSQDDDHKKTLTAPSNTRKKRKGKQPAKLGTKTSDLEVHVKKDHPERDGSSTSSQDDDHKKTLTARSKTRNKRKGKQPAKLLTKSTKTKISDHPDSDDCWSTYDDTDNDPDYIPEKKKKKVEEEVKVENKRHRKVKQSPKKKNTRTGQITEINKLQENIEEIKGAIEQMKKQTKVTTSTVPNVKYSRKSPKNQRTKRACPYCSIEVVHLPRHLRQKHNKSPELARLTVARNRDVIKGITSPSRRYRECPIETCRAKVKYLAQHLKISHGKTSDRAGKWSKKLRYNKSIKDSSTEEDHEENEEIDQEIKSIEMNESENKPSTSKYREKSQSSSEKEEDQKGIRTVDVYDLHSDKHWKGLLVDNKAKEMTRKEFSRTCKSPQSVQQDSKSTDEDIVDDTELTREAIEIESELMKNIDQSEKKQKQAIDKSVVPTLWRTPKTGSELIDNNESVEDEKLAFMSALDLENSHSKSNETEARETETSDVKSKNVEPGVSTEEIMQLDLLSIADTEECITKEKNETENRLNKDEGTDTSQVATRKNEKSGVLAVEELMQEESFTITLVGKAVPRSKRILEEKKSKIPTKIPKASKHCPWHKRKGIKNWREVTILKDYNGFCRSAERNLNIKNAEQQCSQLFVIWRAVDQQGLFRIGSITNPDRIAKLWLEESVKTKQPGTVKSYLCTLQDFWTYLNMIKKIKASELTELNSRRVMWLKRLRKKGKERRVEVMIRDSDERISVEDFDNFKKSDVESQVWKTLRKKKLTQNDINFVVGFIALKIALHNAQRCGAVLGLTLQCFANRVQEADSFVCSVLKHKTGHIQPCELVLTKELSDMIECYLQARRQLPLVKEKGQVRLLAPDSPLFLQWPGTEINSSQMHKLINRVWSETGVKKPVSFTRIRKAVVTQFREVRPGSKFALARHMTHMPSTADKFYSLQEQKKKAVEISKQICEVMSCGETSAAIDEPQAGTSGESSKKDKMTVSKDIDRESEVDNPDESTDVEITETEVADSEASSHGRRLFTKEEQALIKNSCSELIKGHSGIRHNDVVMKMNETEAGKQLVDQMIRKFGRTTGVKKLADRVRTFLREEKKRKK